MNSENWNDKYNTKDYIFGKDPNVFFKQELDKLISGRLLMIGEGEGRNAVYASQKNWHVDAIDISINAKNKAISLANEKNVKLNYLIEDFLITNMKPDFYNAAGFIFVHLNRKQRKKISIKIWESLKIGGKIVVEVFSKNQINYNSGGPNDVELLYNTDEILEDFNCFKTDFLEQTEYIIREGKTHNGLVNVIRFVGTK